MIRHITKKLLKNNFTNSFLKPSVNVVYKSKTTSSVPGYYNIR